VEECYADQGKYFIVLPAKVLGYGEIAERALKPGIPKEPN
jgi:hypothetical protein